MTTVKLPEKDELLKIGTLFSFIDAVAESWEVSFEITRYSGYYISGDGIEHKDEPTYEAEFMMRSFVDPNGDAVKYHSLLAALLGTIKLIELIQREKDEEDGS